MTCHKAFLRGISSYLPQKVLSNADLERLVETNDEWIVSRTGMRERRIAASDEYTSDMAVKASKKVLSKIAVDALTLDLIIVATLTPDYTFPSTACIVQEALGAKRAAAFDISAACSGFVYALSMAKGYISSGMYKNILIIGSEKLSSIVNYEDRNTCVLFGDGAAAGVVSSTRSGFELGSFHLGADGALQDLLIMPAGGVRKPASQETLEAKEHFLCMKEGQEVFKHAIRQMQKVVKTCLDSEGLDFDDLHYLVPHQANIRIIEAIAKRCKLSMDRVATTIEYCGNTSASSIGIGLADLIEKGRIAKDNKIMLTAFGAGLTWGAGLLTAQEDLV
jgi:3-oxoacyl-[acyl-carrier-protein] synthase III